MGVDVLADEVEALRGQGYDVRCHDLSTGPLDDPFDVIVVGEVVEHLDAPVAVLASARQMLRPGGRVVLTTPNPYMLHRVWKHLRGGLPRQRRTTRCSWARPRCSRSPAGRAWPWIPGGACSLKDLPGVRNRLASAVRRLAARTVLTPEIACETLVYELVAPGPVSPVGRVLVRQPKVSRAPRAG